MVTSTSEVFLAAARGGEVWELGCLFLTAWAA
jgi:hypothetical protein